MKEENNRLDQLFESARNEAPLRSFDSSKATLLSGIGASSSTGILAKWANLSFTFKTLIMVGIIGTIATITTVVTLSGSPKEEMKSSSPPATFAKKVELSNEDKQVVVEKTFVNSETEWVEITVSSSLDLDSAEDVVWNNIVDSDIEEEIERLTRDFDIKNLDIKKTNPVPVLEEDTTKTDQKLTTHSYTIHRNSTDEEMAKIRDLACGAGLKLRYNAIMLKGRIKRFTLNVKVQRPDGSSCSHSGKYSGKFQAKINWVTDENGKAIEMWVD